MAHRNYRCPVCETESCTLVCPSCGFDSSCDYETYPSLSQLNNAPNSIARRRSRLQTQDQRILRCPACGKTEGFAVDLQDRMLCCKNCSHRFPLDPALSEPNPHWDSPKVPEQPNKSESATHSVPQKRIRSKAETFTLYLGWIYIPFQTIYLLLQPDAFLFDDDPVLVAIRYWLIIVTILMQIRVWKKGWNEHLPGKLLSGLEIFLSGFGRLLAYWSVAWFVLTVFSSISGSAMSPVIETIWLGMMSVYHATWNFGLKHGLGLPGIFDKS